MTNVTLTIEQAQQIEEALSELMDLMDGVREGDYKPDSFTNQPAEEALATIRAARAQEFTAEQQNRFATAFDEAFAKAGLPQKQAEQEPVCKRCNGTKIVPDGKMYNVDGFQLEVPIECVKDYPDCTAPVRTKDLTDEEIEAAVLSVNTTMEAWITYRAVIAKFKEKNK